MSADLIPLRIVFEPVSDRCPDLVFVEVETLEGRSVRAGKWERYVSGGRTYSALRLDVRAEDIQA